MQSCFLQPQGTENLDGFCDTQVDEFHFHNGESPSRMNRLCGGKSAWEVMEQHEDFNGGANPEINIEIDAV